MALVVDHGVNGGMGLTAISIFVVDAAADLPRHCCWGCSFNEFQYNEVCEVGVSVSSE